LGGGRGHAPASPSCTSSAMGKKKGLSSRWNPKEKLKSYSGSGSGRRKDVMSRDLVAGEKGGGVILYHSWRRTRKRRKSPVLLRGKKKGRRQPLFFSRQDLFFLRSLLSFSFKEKESTSSWSGKRDLLQRVVLLKGEKDGHPPY